MAKPSWARLCVSVGLISCLALVSSARSTAHVSAGRPSGVSARPASIEIVLNPVQDTYLDQGEGRAQDVNSVLKAGWTYTTRLREYRAYLRFPLDPVKHPVEGLIRAELWLYPNIRPESQVAASAVAVSRLTDPFPEGRVAPDWPGAGEPSVEDVLDTRRIDWKQIRVTHIVRDMLNDPDTNYGFEVIGVNPQDSTRWEFVSMEGDKAYPDGNQPRLRLLYSDYAFPTETPIVTDTPTVTATTEPTSTKASTMAPSATVTATRTPTTTTTEAIYLPRVLRSY